MLLGIGERICSFCDSFSIEFGHHLQSHAIAISA
jgi:hypothetical protein